MVCPSTLVPHWAAEAAKFFPDGDDGNDGDDVVEASSGDDATSLSMAATGRRASGRTRMQVVQCVGSPKARRQQLERLERRLAALGQRGAKPGGGAAIAVVVVMSYGVLRRDIERLKRMRWGYVVLDEVHLIRNPQSAVAKAARSLVGQSDAAWMLLLHTHTLAPPAPCSSRPPLAAAAARTPPPRWRFVSAARTKPRLVRSQKAGTPPPFAPHALLSDRWEEPPRPASSQADIDWVSRAHL